jgi:dipeptidase
VKLKRTIFITCTLFILAVLIIGYTKISTRSSVNEPVLLEQTLDHCTVYMVGKDASVDSSVMTTHSADCGICDWTWRHVPAADHEPGSMRNIYHINQMKTWPPDVGNKWDMYIENDTGVEIPQVPRTYAYHHGVFGYMNEHQLAMAESSLIGGIRKMRNPTPSGVFDITTLTLIAMERCKTAREAIKTMGLLAEEYGYGFHDFGEMLAVADPNEVWVFEILSVGPLWTQESGKPGAVWCAQRIPDDHVSICPNESRIGEIDLNNSDYFLASPNVISYAVENELFDPESGKPFNWKKTYFPSDASASSSRGTRARLWRLFDLVVPSQNISPDTPNMELPFSVKPEKKLSAADVMRMTRDKYQGTQFDPVKGLQGGPFKNPNYLPRPFRVDDKTYGTARTIGVNRSEYTTLTVCRDWLPNPIGGVVWLAFGAQDTACYMPLYAGITAIPESFSIGDHWVFNRESARWAFDYVDFHVQVAYSHAIEDVKKAQKIYEMGALEETSAIESTAKALYEQDPGLAAEFLTDYCLQNADKVVKAWWKLGDDLLVKYNHLWVYDAEKRGQSRLQYPEWWLRLLIEYDKKVPMESRR